jgi:PIN domain nuclease of toxin-antitoxin system
MPSKYLLDTHIWLWAQLEPERLSPKVREALDEPGSEIHLSPLSVWEAITLARKGRLDLGPDPAAWTDRALATAPVRPAMLTMDVARTGGALAKPPRDPVDRFLVATALIHGLCLVTADEEILAVAECPLLSNRV